MHSRQTPVWVFDLDDTLHHATPHIFPQINRAMTAYIERHLALDHDVQGTVLHRQYHSAKTRFHGLETSALQYSPG